MPGKSEVGSRKSGDRRHLRAALPTDHRPLSTGNSLAHHFPVPNFPVSFWRLLTTNCTNDTNKNEPQKA
jgi:hypothetical protein